MSTDSISGIGSAYTQAGSSLDSANTLGSESSSSLGTKEGFQAAVVTGTLDLLNKDTGGGSDRSSTYEFNKTILGGHAASLGAVTDINI